MLGGGENAELQVPVETLRVERNCLGEQALYLFAWRAFRWKILAVLRWPSRRGSLRESYQAPSAQSVPVGSTQGNGWERHLTAGSGRPMDVSGSANQSPYIFMGQVEMTAPTPCPALKPSWHALAEEPDNSLANLPLRDGHLKRPEFSANKPATQQVESLPLQAVSLDPKFSTGTCSSAFSRLPT